MAGPFVSGSIGVLKERFPYLSNGDLATVLKTTSTDLGQKGVDEIYGWGLINLDKALKGPGQFLSRFDANFGPGVEDIWSNDIPEAALIQRKQEEQAEIKEWAAQKDKLEAKLQAIPELKTPPQDLITGMQQARSLLKSAIEANDAADYTSSAFDSAMALLRADPYGERLLDVYEAAHPDWVMGYSKSSDYDDFIAGKSDADLASDIVNITRSVNLAANDLVNTEIMVRQLRVDQLSRKTEADYLGGLTKSGLGRLTLTGTNTYAGDTIVNGGELAIGEGGSVASASFINATGLLTVDGTATTVTANDGGALKVNTSGVTRDLTLNGGIASVDGHSGDAAVNAGGTLKGRGYIGALSVHAGGTVAPGNSVGILHAASATFDKASELAIEINGEGKMDQLAVSGSVTLGGVVTVSPEGSADKLKPDALLGLLKQAPSHAYSQSIVSFTDRSGEFDSVEPAYTFIGGTLGYQPNDVVLTLARNKAAFADFANTRNGKAVAANIDSFGFGRDLYDKVVVTTVSDALPSSFNSLSGEIHASLRGVLAEDSRFVRDAASNRIRAAFGNVVGAKAAIPVLAYGFDGADKTAAIWTEGYGSWSNRDSDGNAAGLARNTGGFVTGLDGLVADGLFHSDWRLGLLAGYGNTSLKGGGSSASTDTYQAGLYGGTRLDAVTLSFGASFAHHEIDTDRSAWLGTTTDRNSADYAARSVQLFGEASWRIDTAYAALEPFAGAAHTHLNTSSFTETGGITALSSNRDTTELTTTTLGLRTSQSFALGESTTLAARGMIGWRHAFGDTIPTASHAFAGGSSFAIDGLPVAKDTALVEAGFDVAVGGATRLGISYNGQFSSKTHDNALKADLTVRF